MSTLWTAKEVSLYLGVNIQTVWSWAREGTIPCFKVGDSYRFRQSEVDKWLEQKRVKGVLKSRITSELGQSASSHPSHET